MRRLRNLNAFRKRRAGRVGTVCLVQEALTKIGNMRRGLLIRLIVTVALLAGGTAMWVSPVHARGAPSAASVWSLNTGPSGSHVPGDHALGVMTCSGMACVGIPSLTRLGFPNRPQLGLHRFMHSISKGGRLLNGPDPYPPKDPELL